MNGESIACPYCGAEWPADLEMRFCGECGSKLGALSPEITQKERRTLTVLFADLSGFTTFSEGRDPEAVEDVVDTLLADLGDIVDSYGGYVDKYLGDAVMAVFGAPEAHEDDPLRAVRTGLEMLDTVAAFNEERATSLSLSVGINTGEVLWSQVGGGDYTVTGDAVNVAKRLEAAAGSDTVLVSDSVRERTGTQVRYTRGDAVPVEGREAPVQPSVAESLASGADSGAGGVGGAGAVGGATRQETPLVGREAELARLLDAYEEPAPSFLAVTGPAGIGKSHLRTSFQETVADREETAVLETGHCSEHVDVPLEPFGDLLLSRADTARGDPDAGQRVVRSVEADLSGSDEEFRPTRRGHVAHLLGASVGLDVPDEGLPELAAEQMQAETRRAWRAWLRAIASDHPVVLVVEDLQWADDATRDLLGALREGTAEDAFAQPVTVLTTLRPEGAVPEGFETVELQPLGESDAREIAGAVLDGPAGPALPSFLQEQAGGNPYFVVELLRYLRANDLLERADEGYELAAEEEVSVPETLDGLLVGRIDALPPGSRETVKGASVVGLRFWTGHLAETLEREVSGPVETLTEEEMVHPSEESTLPADEEFAFEHALLRDAVYELLPRSTRVELHGGVAAELVDAVDEERSVLASRIAYHYEQAEQYEQAVEWYRRAGDHAADTYASDDAIANYERAISLAREHGVADDATLANIYAEIAFVGNRSGRYRSALDAVEAGMALAPERSRAMCKLLGFEVDVCEDRGEFDRCWESARQQREIAADIGARGLEFKATYKLGLVAEYRGEYDRARNSYNEALAIARELGDRQREAKALDGLGVALHRQGEYDRAREHLTHALDILQGLDEKFLKKAFLNDLGLVAMNRGEYDRAREYYEEALEIVREIGDRRGEAIVVHNLGEIAQERGRYDRARERYEESLAIERELGSRHGEGISLQMLGDVATELVDYDRARERYDESLAIAREVGDTDMEAECLHGLGVLARERGEHGQAQERLDHALELQAEIGDSRGAALTRLERGLLALERGEVETARERVERAHGTLEEIDAAHPAGRSRKALGTVAERAGSPDEAREHWRAALETFTDVEAPDDALATLEQLVTVCREQGDDERAREWCQRARERLADVPQPVVEHHEEWIEREAGMLSVE